MLNPEEFALSEWARQRLLLEVSHAQVRRINHDSLQDIGHARPQLRRPGRARHERQDSPHDSDRLRSKLRRRPLATALHRRNERTARNDRPPAHGRKLDRSAREGHELRAGQRCPVAQLQALRLRHAPQARPHRRQRRIGTPHQGRLQSLRWPDPDARPDRLQQVQREHGHRPAEADDRSGPAERQRRTGAALQRAARRSPRGVRTPTEGTEPDALRRPHPGRRTVAPTSA